jgi:hypothetical protein
VFVESYNNTKHTGRGMDGSTPAQVLATRSSRRVLLDGALDLLLRVWSGECIVGKNGVRFKNMLYGQYDGRLLSRYGEKVRVSYDPDDIRRISIYDARTFELITIAEQNQLIRYGSPVDEEHLREAMKQKASATRKIRDYIPSQRIANTSLADLTAKAMQDAREDIPETPPQSIKLAATPLDDQIHGHRRRENIRKIKKAVGAESMNTVVDLAIDYNMIASQKNNTEKTINLNLFGGIDDG